MWTVLMWYMHYTKGLHIIYYILYVLDRLNGSKLGFYYNCCLMKPYIKASNHG